MIAQPPGPPSLFLPPALPSAALTPPALCCALLQKLIRDEDSDEEEFDDADYDVAEEMLYEFFVCEWGSWAGPGV